MISHSLTWHLLVSFFAAVSRSVKSSLVFNGLMSFFDWITKQVKESGLYNWLGKDVFTEKYYETSVFYGILNKIWNFILSITQKLQALTKRIFKNSFCLYIFELLQAKGVLSVDCFLAIFLGVMFIAPHQVWNNLYAALGAVFFAFWIVLNIASGKLKCRNIGGIGVAIVIFIAAIGVSVVTAYVVSDALRIAIFFVASVILAYCVCASVDTREKLVRFIKIVLFFVTLTAVYGVAQRFMGVEVDLEFVDVVTNEGMPGRVFSTFSNPNNFAELLLLFMPFYVPLFLSVQKKSEKWAVLAGLCITLCALAMTYSRSCWIGFALAAVVFVCLYDKRLLIPMVILAIVAIPFLPKTIINRILTIGSMKDSSNSYRVYIWESCLKIIRDYGWTGIGLGPASFRVIYPGYASPVAVTAPHSHMLYMELIIEMGILGAVGFFSYIFATVKKAVGTMRRMDKNLKLYVVAGISALCGIAFVCCVEYIWFYPRVMFAFWIIPGLLMATVRLAKTEK